MMPDLVCLMLTSFADDEAIFASVMAGAAGYVLKQIKARDLISDVHRVAAGESLMDPRIVARVVERISNPPKSDPEFQALTPQEQRILDLIAEGQTNRQIAESMFLAEHTVKNYITGLLRKLKMSSRTEAAIYATKLKAAKGRDGEPEALVLCSASSTRPRDRYQSATSSPSSRARSSLGCENRSGITADSVSLADLDERSVVGEFSGQSGRGTFAIGDESSICTRHTARSR